MFDIKLLIGLSNDNSCNNSDNMNHKKKFFYQILKVLKSRKNFFLSILELLKLWNLF